MDNERKRRILERMKADEEELALAAEIQAKLEPPDRDPLTRAERVAVLDEELAKLPSDPGERET